MLVLNLFLQSHDSYRIDRDSDVRLLSIGSSENEEVWVPTSQHQRQIVINYNIIIIDNIRLENIIIKSMYIRWRAGVCRSDDEIRHLRPHHAMLALMPESSATLTIPRGALKRPWLCPMKWAILKFYVPSQGRRGQNCFPWRCFNCYFAPPWHDNISLLQAILHYLTLFTLSTLPSCLVQYNFM